MNKVQHVDERQGPQEWGNKEEMALKTECFDGIVMACPDPSPDLPQHCG